MTTIQDCAIYPSLKDKVVLITGGASGIGSSIVEHFCIQQSKVVFLDINDKEAKEVIKFNSSKYSNEPIYYNCDLTDTEKLISTINKIGSDIGGVSILINSAAHDERHEMDSVTSEYWDNRMNANIKHFFFASQTCSKMMKNNGGGTIVNIGSFSWMMGIGGMICYTTAKSAVSGLTRSLARELGEYNIRVNCVVPGWIMTKRQLDLWVTPEVKKQQLEKQCLKRLLEPNEIAKAILFFASEDSSATSAQNFVFDGGIVN